ncbi:hypothetical protein N2152v2_007029 [Parachlorella kessleri]
MLHRPPAAAPHRPAVLQRSRLRPGEEGRLSYTREQQQLGRRRRQQRGDLRCRTVEPGSLVGPTGAFVRGRGLPALGPQPGSAETHTVTPASAQNGASPTETFQQLRQAALTSLDFAYDNADESSDFDDSQYDQDELTSDTPGGPAPVAGRAIYETLRIDQSGKTRRVYVKRRDLIRAHGLQPRDLRRVDPSLSPTKQSPNVTIKEECVLINIGGIRAVITADKCLLFEPSSPSSRKFLETVTPKLMASAALRVRKGAFEARQESRREGGARDRNGRGRGTSSYDEFDNQEDRIFPFELELVEGALIVATGKLEQELVAVTRRVSSMLQKLPREITPVNLEELRRVKQALVELESKAENLRDLLEELMDDEDEIRELNLSSRPKREEKRKQRERERLEREMERELADRGVKAIEEAPHIPVSSSHDGVVAIGPTLLQPTKATKPSSSTSSSTSVKERSKDRDRSEDEDDGYQEAQDALEEMFEEEEEEREVEEVEDLLEYYLQRAATTQSEAERLLAGARDLEESIGVSLSARRFEVNRLELLLSIASFAAALGAMVASIFGMNLRSTLEMSVIGFWGTTIMIIAGSWWIFWVLYRHTKRKRIL